MSLPLRRGLIPGIVLAIGVACQGGAGSPVALSARGGVAGGGGGGSATALVGQWTHQLVFLDSSGAALLAATVWRFDSGGGATQSVVAANLTAGVADTVLSTATWTTTADSLTVTYLSPATGTATFGWRIGGVAPSDTLYLNGLPFPRTGS